MLLMRFVIFSNSRKGFHRISVFIIIFGRCGCLTAIPATGAGFRSFVSEGCLNGPALTGPPDGNSGALSMG